MADSAIPDTPSFTGLSTDEWELELLDADDTLYTELPTGTLSAGKRRESAFDPDSAFDTADVELGVETDVLPDTALEFGTDLPAVDPFGIDTERLTSPEREKASVANDLLPLEGGGTWLADARLDEGGSIPSGTDVVASNEASPAGADEIRWEFVQAENHRLNVEDRSWEPVLESADLESVDLLREEEASAPSRWKFWTWDWDWGRNDRSGDGVTPAAVDRESGERLDELLADGTERWQPKFRPNDAELILPAREIGETTKPQLYAVDGLEVHFAPGRGEQLDFSELPEPPDGTLRTLGTYSYQEANGDPGETFLVGTSITTPEDDPDTPENEAQTIVREGENPKADHRGIVGQRADGSLFIGRTSGDTFEDIQREFRGEAVSGPSEARIRAFNPYLPEDLHLYGSHSPVVEAVGGFALIYEGGKPVVGSLGEKTETGGQDFDNGPNSAQLGSVTNRSVFIELSSGHLVQMIVPTQIDERTGEEGGMNVEQLQDYLDKLEVPVFGQDEPATVVNAVTGDAGTPGYAVEHDVPGGGSRVPQNRTLSQGRPGNNFYFSHSYVDTTVSETRLEDDPSLSDAVSGGDDDPSLSDAVP